MVRIIEAETGTKDTTKEFEVTLPEQNTADAWNAQIIEGAEKAGVEIPRDDQGRFTSPAAGAEKKDSEADKVYESTLNVNGTEMVFRGKDAGDVLQQYSAAVTAAQLATAKPAPAAKEDPKPAFTEAEMFDISLGIQQGKTEALDKYILNSGLMDRYLESKGLSIETLKTQTENGKDAGIKTQWATAAKTFMEKTPDFQATEQNNYIMGLMLGELKLAGTPTVESYEKAYERMKERKLVFPGTAAAAATTVTKKKDPPASTAVGHAGTHETRQNAIDQTKKYEIDISPSSGLTMREAAATYNEMVARGVKPENISYKR